MEAERFTVRKVLPMLWEVHDARRYLTEFVLFADTGLGHARMSITDELLADIPGARSEGLRLLAKRATGDGVHHSFTPPPRLSRVTMC